MTIDFPQTRISGKARSGVPVSLPAKNRPGHAQDRNGQIASRAPRARNGLTS